MSVAGPEPPGGAITRPAQRASRRTRGVERPLIVLALLCYAYFVPRGVNWNADSHLVLTRALVERHTAVIDAYAAGLGDRSFYHGHYYTDKAPGLSLLAVPAYLLLKALLGPAFFGALFFVVRYLLTLLVVGLPTALAAATLSRRLRPHVGARGALAAAGVWALGTLAFPYSTVFFSHQMAAVLLMVAFLALYLPAAPAVPVSMASRLGIGLLCGVAVACEYPTLLLAAVLLGGRVLLARSSRAAVTWALPLGAGMLVGVAPALIYNSLVFGGPLAQGYAHLGGQQQFIKGMSQGVMGITGPSLEALWGITFSPYRGLFLISPFLLLAVPGLGAMWRTRPLLASNQVGPRAAAVVCATCVVIYGLFNISYLFWNGGFSVGPRHFTPALPYLIVPCAFALRSQWVRRLAVPLALYSVGAMLLAGATAPLFSPDLLNPLFGWAPTRLLAGHVANNWGFFLGLRGAASILPLLVMGALLLTLLWRRVSSLERGLPT